jgi:hypothetical protein
MWACRPRSIRSPSPDGQCCCGAARRRRQSCQPPSTSSRGRRPSGDADPPYVFELGPDHGRRTFDAVQSGPSKEATRPHRGTIGPLPRPPGGHSTPRTTSGSRAASAAGVAVAACPASSSRRSLGLGAAILREFVRPPSGPPLRVASERSLCLAREVGCILLGGPPVTTAAAGPMDRRLFGLVGRGVRLGSATSGQRGPPSVALPRTAPWHRRRSSPGRPPGRRGRTAQPGALRPPRGHGAGSEVEHRDPGQPAQQAAPATCADQYA